MIEQTIYRYTLEKKEKLMDVIVDELHIRLIVRNNKNAVNSYVTGNIYITVTVSNSNRICPVRIERAGRMIDIDKNSRIGCRVDIISWGKIPA